MIDKNKIISFTAKLILLAAAFTILAPLGARGQESALPPDWLTDSQPAIRVAVKARREVTISSPTAGVIKRLPMVDGGRFQEGEVLLELDCGVLEAQAGRARAQANRQKLILESNQRLSSLNSKSALEVALSKAETEAAEAEALSMDKMVEQCRVTAPFTGRVGDLLVKENQFVSMGQPIMEILDDSRLQLEFIVPSNWLSWFKPGYEFEFTVDETGTRHQAALDHLGGRVDPVSQSIKAYARLLEQNPGLMPGMSGTVHLKNQPQAEPARP